MSNVPHRTNTRASHARGVGTRDTHTEDSYLPPIEASAEVFKQTNIDGIVSQQDIIPGAVGTPELRDGAVIGSKIEAGAIHVSKFGGSPRNLVANGDFEDVSYHVVDQLINNNNKLSGWDPLGGDGTYMVSPSAFKFGGYAIKSTRPGDTAQRDIRSIKVPVVGSMRVMLRFWYRGHGGNNAAAAILGALHAYKTDGVTSATTQNPVNSGSLTIGASTTWTEYKAYGTLSDDSAYCQIVLRQVATVGGTTDVIWFDGIEFYYVAEDVSHAGGDVKIDSTGITVNNGKITLKDEFATTVMVASGFAGDWQNFLSQGLYNGSFQSGTPGTIALGRTANLPYWNFSRTGTPTVTYSAPGASSNGSVVNGFTALSDVVNLGSDLVAVEPNTDYQLRVAWSASTAAGTTRLTAYIWWYLNDGLNTVGSTPSYIVAEVVGADTITGINWTVSDAFNSPDTAYYMQVFLVWTEVTTHNTNNHITCYGVIAERAVSSANISWPGYTSFTPSVTGAGSATFSNTGYYKYLSPDTVHIIFYITLTANGTGAGPISVTGGPDISRSTRQVLTGHSDGSATMDGVCQLVSFVGGTANVWDRLRWYTGANYAGTDVDNAQLLTIEGVYRVA